MSAPTRADKAAADRVLNAAIKRAVVYLRAGKRAAAVSLLDSARVVADLLLERKDA